MTGVPTGLTKLDEMTAGLQPSDLILIAGRPSMGKTAFALSIAQHVGIKLRMKILVLSLEMSAQQLVQRMLSSEGRVDSLAVRPGRLQAQDWHRLTSAAGRLSERDILEFLRNSPMTLKVVITSRERVSDGQIIRLQGLSFEESNALLEWDAQQRNIQLTKDQNRYLVELTGGLPLALLWVQGWRNWIAGLIEGRTTVLSLWLLREVLWWGAITMMIALIVGLLARSEMGRLVFRRSRETSAA